MFLRGKEPEASVWRRFRTGLDGFTFSHEDGYYAARVNANAERVVDLFHALTEQLPPAVDVAMEDLRTGRRWTGGNVALPDVREAIARLKVVLTAHAGVEMAVFTDEDQVTLSPHLELYVYSRTDQWFYVLRGKGLEHRESMRERSWRLRPEQFAPAPELEALLEKAVDRLALVSA